MKLNNKQKEFYASFFEDDFYLEEIRKIFDKNWELIYDPCPDDFDYALIVDGLEWDRLSDEFVKEIERNI